MTIFIAASATRLFNNIRDAIDPDFRFNDIYNFITYPEWLLQAFYSVKANHGSSTAGVDGETVTDFADDLKENIEKLSQQLDSESYEPDPTRRVYIPKGGGEKHPLSIPTVRDRIVQEALRMLLGPIYECDFSSILSASGLDGAPTTRLKSCDRA